MGIKRLEIAGFKSIDGIELTDLPNYCVFAGANGAGKSNFFDALKFTSAIIDVGAFKAIRQFQGYERIHCVKRRKDKATTFRFVCDIESPRYGADYFLQVRQMDQMPELQERLTVSYPNESKLRCVRGPDGMMRINNIEMGRHLRDYSIMKEDFP